MGETAYRRDSVPGFTELHFPPPAVLDPELLRRRWAPWLELTASPEAPLRACHALHLAQMLAGEQDPAGPHWFSIVSPAGQRAQIIRQARLEGSAVDRPEELPQDRRTAHWQLLVDTVDRWDELSTERRIVVVELLTQLGFHRRVVELVPRVSAADAGPLGQRLGYEAARSAFELNRRSPVPLRLLQWLGEHAEHPGLRVAAALRVVSALSRLHRDPDGADRWLAHAAAALDTVDRAGWLSHLMRSRYHRAGALCRVARRDPAGCTEHLLAALRHDEALGGLATGGLVRHYWMENRQLVLEACLKLDTMAGTELTPVDAVEQARLARPDQDLLAAIGECAASRERWARAHQAFALAADFGTVHGAVAAWRGGECLERLGRTAEAAAAYRLCLDLDPASRSARERLAVLARPAAAGVTGVRG